MLLGFKRRFAPYVLDGSKQHTIRATRKRQPKVGEICHCYVDPRQKSMKLLGRWPCVKVEDIYISGPNFPGVYINGTRLSSDECDLLAWSDGFRHPMPGAPPDCREGLGYGGCFDLMMEFWKGRLPFEGIIIHWKWSKQKGVGV